VDNLVRCPWVDPEDALYASYHDFEWGVPVHDDRLWFEFLTLEGAQAGLSWKTVLRKREAYREAFDGFDPARVAGFGVSKIESLLGNPGIIRNRAKITAAVSNASAFLRVQDLLGSFDAYMWGFVGGEPIVHRISGLADYRATSPESDSMSLDMKKRGFRFVGSTICYAHMQATGLVNDHMLGCFRRREILDSAGRRGG
jgi:DNA-3-methyladenine glycosylase I